MREDCATWICSTPDLPRSRRRAPRPFLHLLCLASLAALLTACTPDRTNILLVTFDTTRWDHVGYASGRKGLTPMLDAMAARGVWFKTCISSQPLTLPSHTSIMTGLYPYHHGVRNNGSYIVPERNLTLAERLKGAGYQTHAVISAFVLDSQFGLDQGFYTYDDDLSGGPEQKMFMFKELEAARTALKAARWVRTDWNRERPFFLWLHFFDPHADYEPPTDVATQFPGDPYSGEIAYADRELGRVFKELELMKQLDKTLVIFTSDHGDGLGEHGEKTHGLFVYDSTTHVPLLMAGPGVPTKGRVDTVVRTVDIVPTVLDLLDLPSKTELDGESLEPLWSGKAADRTAYIETIMPRQNFGWSELRALRTGTTKAIQAPRPELYDLEKDPGEQINRMIIDGIDADTSGLFPKLETLTAKDPFSRGEQQQADMDQETRRKLSALGYTWDAPAPAEGPLPDPKDRLMFWERFQTAQTLIRQKSYERAAALITALLRDDPDNLIAKSSLANALTRMGEADRALELYRDLISMDAHRETPYLGAARLLAGKEQYEEAEQLIRTVLEMQPENPEGYTALADLYLEQERYDEAESWFRKALEIDEHSSLAAGGLGNCLNRAGKLKEAAQVLTAARQKDPSSHTVTYNLAVVSERLGDRRVALELYKIAIQLEPDHSMTWNNLGSLLEREGEPKEALKFVAKAYELDPENVEATYNLGALLAKGNAPGKALRFLEEAIRIDPTLFRAHLLRNRTLEKLDRTEEALAAWRALSGAMPQALLHVARLEAKAGRKDEAREALRQGLARDGEKFRTAASRSPDLSALLDGLESSAPR